MGEGLVIAREDCRSALRNSQLIFAIAVSVAAMTVPLATAETLAETLASAEELGKSKLVTARLRNKCRRDGQAPKRRHDVTPSRQYGVISRHAAAPPLASAGPFNHPVDFPDRLVLELF